jgi:hypothetical protein
VAPVALLALKLLLTPSLIGLASLAVRRWGPGVGGWLVGLPLTSGPVSVFLAVEQGSAFAARAAGGTLAGLGGVGAFCFAYGLAAPRVGWPLSTAVGLLAFGVTTAALAALALPVPAGFVAVCGLLVACALGLAGPAPVRVAAAPPWWDVPFRMAVATGLVLTITTAAATLGPRLSGLLSPIPVFAMVLAVFTHRTGGARATIHLLRGVVLGSFAFAAFLLVVGTGLERLGILTTYVLAVVVALGVNGLLLGPARR